MSSPVSHSNVCEIDDTPHSPRLHISGATVPTTPTNATATPSSSTRKKRKSRLSPQEKVEKVKVVLAAIAVAKTDGLFKDGTRKTKVQILGEHGICESQLTRWQQYCIICCTFYKRHKDSFLCTNTLCESTFCKTCLGQEVVRQLLLEDTYQHVSSFQCMTCRKIEAFDLSLANDADATRRNGLGDAIVVHVKFLLKENDELLAPLMSQLCSFRSKMKRNYEDRAHQLFNGEEEETVLEFLSLFQQYSGLKVDNNKVKKNLRQISFAIQWLYDSYGRVLEDESELRALMKHKYEGWFAMMIEFGLKCHERMVQLETHFNIKKYPFWEGLQLISIAEQTIIVE